MTINYLLAICIFLASSLMACTNQPKQTIPPESKIDNPGPSPTLPAAVKKGSLSPALEMHTAHAAHTATALPDGRVLIAGGFRSEGTAEIPIAAAEIFDPQNNTFTPVSDMVTARTGHTATLLPDGQVLIAGGWGVDGRLASTELFDPQTNTFSLAAGLTAPRASMTATLLPNGRVLIAGGDYARNQPQLTAELYDPQTNTFTPSGTLNQGRISHSATLLLDGRVFLFGGRPDNNGNILASAEIYDPATGEFTLAGSSRTARHKHTAVLLDDGQVLIAGGSDNRDWEGQYSSAELYDPQSATFTPTAELSKPRFKLLDAALRLNDGTVLIGGGSRQLELFEPQSQQFRPTDQIDDAYYFAVLALLPDNRVLITGGYNGAVQPSAKAWIYGY